ncbi:Mitotic checkpoint protein BUB3, putative [Brugia malayi]|uniref:BMA-BUB-3, isoform b n=1 Tax=Brugia malayi TaxID=6279 RepID=A0A1P6BLH6_BRUMA|nr:Mitotic checkpoint protein BUB3, putative [Brugia malayi]CDP93729.1 BMA-BUB-3, isoform b [Brugia malayi]VIO99452.1 Mitotic checkpoint protein BUB3, putative [Brugia malayi]
MFHFAGGSTEGTIPHPSNTQISKVQFSPDDNGQLLAVSSWEGTVRIYHFPAGPVTALEKRIYTHAKPVLACTFFLWDPRSKSSAGFGNNGDKVYAMDVHGNRILVGTKDRKIIVWDVRNLGEPEQIRDSPLKFQTRAVKCFPNGEAFVVASIEGRVAVEYFDMSAEVQKNKYAFKCHREKDESGTEMIYPVNCIDFHPIHNTFVTGGSDALVNIWDPFNRKRICQLHKFVYLFSIMSVSFNATGTQLAIAASYMNELKERPNPEPESTVVVRKITDVEARPK